MKKIVIGLIIGALLMFSGQALADSISKVGKRVQGEYTVKVDGKTLDAKALAIDGQTTIPGRALADAVGYDVAFKNKEVILTKKEGVELVEQTGEIVEEPVEEPVVVVTPSPEPEVTEPQYTLESITSLIKSREDAYRPIKRLYDTVKADGQEGLEDTEARLKAMEDELTQLKSIKAQLEAQQ